MVSNQHTVNTWNFPGHRLAPLGGDTLSPIFTGYIDVIICVSITLFLPPGRHLLPEMVYAFRGLLWFVNGRIYIFYHVNSMA